MAIIKLSDFQTLVNRLSSVYNTHDLTFTYNITNTNIPTSLDVTNLYNAFQTAYQEEHLNNVVLWNISANELNVGATMEQQTIDNIDSSLLSMEAQAHYTRTINTAGVGYTQTINSSDGTTDTYTLNVNVTTYSKTTNEKLGVSYTQILNSADTITYSETINSNVTTYSQTYESNVVCEHVTAKNSSRYLGQHSYNSNVQNDNDGTSYTNTSASNSSRYIGHHSYNSNIHNTAGITYTQSTASNSSRYLGQHNHSGKSAYGYYNTSYDGHTYDSQTTNTAATTYTQTVNSSYGTYNTSYDGYTYDSRTTNGNVLTYTQTQYSPGGYYNTSYDGHTYDSVDKSTNIVSYSAEASYSNEGTSYTQYAYCTTQYAETPNNATTTYTSFTANSSNQIGYDKTYMVDSATYIETTNYIEGVSFSNIVRPATTYERTVNSTDTTTYTES